MVVYFTFYSVAGWLCETLYCSIPSRQFVKRGFLRGPLCPIYGVGALVILLVAHPVAHSPVLVLLLSMLSSTLLEYVAGWLLEKLFHVRWWDYTGKRFQIGGRIRLKNSVLFGGLGLAVTYLIHPIVADCIERIPHHTLRIIANILLASLLLDFITTIARLTGFAQKLRELQADLQALRECEQQYKWFDRSDLEGSLERLLQHSPPELEGRAWIARLESALDKKRSAVPQLRAYKSARSRRFSEAWEAVQKDFENRKPAGTPHPLRLGMRRVRQKTTSAGCSVAKTIWGNLRYLQLLWVFLLAGVLGYLVETLYCLLTTGAIESRQGLLYGPFNQVYGFGAVLMVLLLTPLSKKNDRWVFAGSALLGGAFEVFCSWSQEAVFGSVSWQYAQDRFAIAGGAPACCFCFSGACWAVGSSRSCIHGSRLSWSGFPANRCLA